MPEYTETKTRLIINKLSREKYDYLVSNNLINENELYLVKDTNLDAVSDRLINVGNPVSATDGANKQYIDGLIDGLDDIFYKLPSGGIPATDIAPNVIPDKTSDLVNDGADGTNPFITMGAVSGKADFSYVSAGFESLSSSKLDATAAAPDFLPTSTYFVNDFVTHDGKLYQCVSAVTTPGEWQPSKWAEVDMTSPDATLDITNDGFLRVVDASGSILWAEGYNLLSDSSSTIKNWAVDCYTFAENTTTGVTLTLPGVMPGKVGDFVLDVINPVLNTSSLPTAFSNSSTYTTGNIVSYDSKIWRCVVAVETAGAWTGTDNWEEAWPYFEISGMGSSISVVIPADEDLNEMLSFAPGTTCELYFTQTAFNVNSKPTWKVVRQDVENGGAS